jgi:hypothetical protein
LSAGFQPAWPTAFRWLTKVMDARAWAQEVRVHVHDELWRLRLRQFRGAAGALGLGLAHLEERPVDLVHRDERGRHAGGGAEEFPPRHAVLARVLGAQRLHQRLHFALTLGLRDGEEFVARYDLRRNW